MYRDDIGKSADTLIHNAPSDLERETDRSRLKQILSMYGLDSIQEKDNSSRQKL